MQLFLLKQQRPDLFARIRHSTWLPQWLSGCFTGQLYSESTSIGCHTLCWDFLQHGFPEWTRAEGISRLFPPMRPADSPMKVHINGRELIAGIGLHDSSSALIPYLRSIPHPFMLLSTGSWSICLNPFNEAPLTQAELAADGLCYLSYQGRPVKASRLDAGFRHEAAVEALCREHGKDADFFFRLDWNPRLAAGVRNAHDAAGVDPAVAGYYACIDGLVTDQLRKVGLVSSPHVRQLYVDGGFSRNAVFMGMLRERLPGWEVRSAEVGQATALGAAVVLHPAWNVFRLPDGLIRC
jgi:hypothetical protein